MARRRSSQPDLDGRPSARPAGTRTAGTSRPQPLSFGAAAIRKKPKPILTGFGFFVQQGLSASGLGNKIDIERIVGKVDNTRRVCEAVPLRTDAQDVNASGFYITECVITERVCQRVDRLSEVAARQHYSYISYAATVLVHDTAADLGVGGGGAGAEGHRHIIDTVPVIVPDLVNVLPP